jgi:hypothetical protein
MSDKEHNAELFHELCASVFSGFARSHNAKIVANTAQIAILKTLITEKDKPEYQYVASDSGIGKVSLQEFQCFEYVSESGMLVYSTAIFDTFLSDATKFLIYLNPGPYRDNLAVSYEEVEGAKSISDLRKKVIDKKVRQISYRSFRERLKELKRAYGLILNLSNEQIALLEDISSVRNAIAHDQSFLDLGFDEDGNVTLKQTSCSTHPVPLRKDVYSETYKVFIEVFRALYIAINEQMFGIHSGERYEKFIAAMKV